jgi:hypothetical protein
MKRETDKSILGKAILFALLVIIITAVGGLMPLTAGKKIESKKLDNQRPFFPAIPRESVKLRLASGGFDPLMKPEPDKFTERLSIKAYAHGEQGYHIVQFDGPVRAQQRKKLEQLGAQVFDYLPDFAFIVKMDDESRVAVELMKNVRWVGIYQPIYRIEPALAKTIMAGETYSQGEFIVTLFPREDIGLITEHIEHLGGVVLDVSEYHQRAKLKIRLFLEDVQTVSKITGVKWIERAPIWKLHNNVSAGIMDATDVWDTHNLYGAGQVVCVADSGLDQGSTAPANLHDDFENGSGVSRASTIFDRVGDGASDVNSGHGTHVAGSVLGNGAVSGSNPATHTYTNSYAGIAPEAILVFQALEDNMTGALSGIPNDLNTLFSQAYGAGATIHTNSWGDFQGGAYTSFSEDVDQFVWNNKGFLVLFSAGNDGVDADGDGVIDLTSMETPATAKNCITVGATENNRPTGSSPSPGYNSSWGTLWPDDYPAAPINSDHVSDDADGIAAFSSRGPCLDGRFKPDIVAPGTNIISTKSSLTANTALWGKGGLSTSGSEAQYIFSGGTSMSTPLTAGVATLARDFFTDVEGITPSAALIKATLLNGAADISPGQYGTGSTQEIPDPPRPNNVEGWGRVNLEPSIFPTAPTTLRYADITTSLNTGESRIYNFTLGSGAVPLKATLVWSDYPGSAVSGGGLTNDLDLSVIDPLGTTHYANRASQRGQTQVISYDDGGATGYYMWVSGNRVGVRFTPTAYPVRLDKGLFLLGSTSYPNTFTYYVYDGSDETGPQNLLASGTTTIRGSGWHVVDLSNHAVTANSGDFFVAIELNSNLAWYYDDTSPDERSWDYAGGNWTKWTNNDYMFRAVVTTPDYSTPYDRVNNVVGIDIASPATGSYSIRVEGYNVPQGPQPYALVVTGGTLSALTEVTPPAVPSSLSASSVSETQINLSWTDNSINEDGFRIERKTGSGGTYSEIATVGADVTSYNNTGLSEATSYYYRVRAYNSAGNSSYCDEANATTYPAAPSGLSASAASSSQINLSWTDNSSGESGFKIERKTGSGGTYSQITIVSANVTTYSNTGLSEATTYYYRVRAYNSADNSNYSNEANATTLSAGGGGGGGGGCFIATAAYGSSMEPHVMVLRDFRDSVLLTNNVGRSFVELYYNYSPSVADFIASHDTVRFIVRWSLMPIVGISWMSLNIGLMLTLTTILLMLIFINISIVVLFRRIRMRTHRT